MIITIEMLILFFIFEKLIVFLKLLHIEKSLPILYTALLENFIKKKVSKFHLYI